MITTAIINMLTIKKDQLGVIRDTVIADQMVNTAIVEVLQIEILRIVEVVRIRVVLLIRGEVNVIPAALVLIQTPIRIHVHQMIEEVKSL